jgi:hypothetical protein
MCTFGRFLICVAVALATAPIAAAQAPRDERSGQEAEARGPVVPGFGNEFETRPVPGFGPPEEEPGESSDASSPVPRGNRGPIRSSPPAHGVRSLGTPLPRAATAKPVAQRFLTAAERLPEGLPDWFRQKDANGDGQISMAEYATDWNDAKVREYRKWDLNGDGVIEPSEALKVLGSDATRQAKSSAKAASAVPRADPPAAVKSADAIQSRNERRADSLVRIFLMRYDRDGSGALEAAEWPALPWQDPSRWDTNHDRRLTADELATRFASPQR